MPRGNIRWIAAGSLIALAGVGFLVVRHGSQSRSHLMDEASRDGFQGFSTRPFANTPAPPPPETPDQVAHQVDGVMERWRGAILNKDAPTVVSCDMDFMQRPDRYREALEKSAEHEENERVRAFSTRVLGKMKNPAEAALLTRLLADPSPYVRQNAAWALGELRGGAASAVAELRRARARDSAPAVRMAAKDALGKVE